MKNIAGFGVATEDEAKDAIRRGDTAQFAAWMAEMKRRRTANMAAGRARFEAKAAAGAYRRERPSEVEDVTGIPLDENGEY